MINSIYYNIFPFLEVSESYRVQHCTKAAGIIDLSVYLSTSLFFFCFCGMSVCHELMMIRQHDNLLRDSDLVFTKQTVPACTGSMTYNSEKMHYFSEIQRCFVKLLLMIVVRKCL